MLNKLLTAIPPQRILEVLEGLLSATITTKSGAQPDFRAREAGLKLFISCMAAFPVERQVTDSPQPVEDKDVWKEIRSSPAALDFIRARLREIDDDTSAPADQSPGWN